MKTADMLKYRNHWMGLAIFCVVMYHSELFIDSAALTFAKTFLYGGVDLFLFASGIGCYFSLNKDSDNINFMKRRLYRIMPVYCVFMCFWCTYEFFFHQMRLRSILGNFLGIQYFTSNDDFFNWYISAILLFYLIAPYFKQFLDRTASNKGRFFLLCFLVLASIPFWGTQFFILTVTRIPIFYIGMWFGKECTKEELPKRFISVCMMLMIFGILILIFANLFLQERLWGIGMYWYPFILITPGVGVLLSLLFKGMEKMKGISLIGKGFSALGKISFEIYLTHIFVFHVLAHHVYPNSSIPDFIFWLLAWLSLAPTTALLIGLTHLVKKNLLHGEK